MAKKRRWSASVKTESTHPPAGLFKKNAATIARTLASKRVSPKGPASGMRMLTFFINRAGRNLSPKRRAELNKAKSLLSERVRRARGTKTQELVLNSVPRVPRENPAAEFTRHVPVKDANIKNIGRNWEAQLEWAFAPQRSTARASARHAE